MTLPASHKASGFYGRVDASQNIRSATGKPRLIIAQKLAAGTAVVDTPVLVLSESKAITLFGQGSHAHLMSKVALDNNRTIPLYVIPVADHGSAAKATGKLDVTVTTAEAGTLHLYIAGQKVQVAVSAGDTADDIAAAIVAAITAAPDLPVTAAVNGVNANEVDLTAKNGGTLGNGIDLQLNYFGEVGGEETPTGVTVAITAMSSGATDPDLSNAVAAMGDTEYDYGAWAFTDATNLNLIGAELDDSDTGRWGQFRQLYGHWFTSKIDSLSNLVTFGGTRNDQHVSVLGLASMPSPVWEVAAALMSVAAGSLSVRPRNPISKVALKGILGPKAADRFDGTERSTLLNNGIAAAVVNDQGEVVLDVCATTYQTDSQGNDDDSYHEVQTPATNQALMRLWKARSQKYQEFSLVGDDKKLRAGVEKVTTAKKVVGDVFIGGYREAIRNGWCEDMAGFKERLNWNLEGGRIVVSELPADLANPLRQFDVTLSFQLDFAA